MSPLFFQRKTKSLDEQREEKSWAVDLFHLQELNLISNSDYNYLLTESEVFTVKYQTEYMLYTARPRFDISP